MLLRYAQDSTPLPGEPSDGSYRHSFTPRLGQESLADVLSEPSTEITIPWGLDDESTADAGRVCVVRFAYCHSPQRNDRKSSKTSFTNSEWIFSVVNSTDADGTAPLDATIDGINSLIEKRDFVFLDRVLRLISDDRINRYALLGMARATFPVRSKLSYWQLFISNCHRALKNRGLDADKLLKGLR